jgi:hypothetical protein
VHRHIFVQTLFLQGFKERMRRLMIFCGLDGEAQARCCDLSEEGWKYVVSMG